VTEERRRALLAEIRGALNIASPSFKCPDKDTLHIYCVQLLKIVADLEDEAEASREHRSTHE
jgi:hypothetical protein